MKKKTKTTKRARRNPGERWEADRARLAHEKYKREVAVTDRFPSGVTRRWQRFLERAHESLAGLKPTPQSDLAPVGVTWEHVEFVAHLFQKIDTLEMERDHEIALKNLAIEAARHVQEALSAHAAFRKLVEAGPPEADGRGQSADEF